MPAHPPQPSQRKLILASASPRRRELLTEAGYRFEIDPADVDESDVPADLPPAGIAELLAARKAAVVAARHPAHVTLAADTVVAHGTQTLGKAVDADDARRILRTLSGSRHEVITAIRVVCPASKIELSATVRSTVIMRPMSDDELQRYIATGLWEGKAGAYGIQDNDPFVTRIEGSLTNIVGLPMEATKELLIKAGIAPVTAI